MEFIIDNWPVIVAIIAGIALAVVTIIKFTNSSTEEQLKDVREWLIFATSLAEKELGGGTGPLKLRSVYDMFLSKFPWMAKIITFERFSSLVDEALPAMKELLKNNSAVQNYVNGSNEEKEIDIEK